MSIPPIKVAAASPITTWRIMGFPFVSSTDCDSGPVHPCQLQFFSDAAGVSAAPRRPQAGHRFSLGLHGAVRLVHVVPQACSDFALVLAEVERCSPSVLAPQSSPGIAGNC